MPAQTTIVGKRGTIVIPARMRKNYGIQDGSVVLTEETAEGILLRPASVTPVEIYSAERKAYFLLSNAIDEQDYKNACAEVKKLGLEPHNIQHETPWK